MENNEDENHLVYLCLFSDESVGKCGLLVCFELSLEFRSCPCLAFSTYFISIKKSLNEFRFYKFFSIYYVFDPKKGNDRRVKRVQSEEGILQFFIFLIFSFLK